MKRIIFLQTNKHWTAIAQAHLQLMQQAAGHWKPYVACTPHGVARQNTAPLERLQAAGIDVLPMKFTPPEALSQGFLGKLLYVLMIPLCLMRLYGHMRSQGIDLIYVSNQKLECIYALLLNLITRKPFIVHLHVKYQDNLPWATRLALKRCDRVIAVSEFVRTTVATRVPIRKVFVVHNSYDIPQTTAESQGHKVREEFGFNSKTMVFGIVGRLTGYKGHHELIEAFSEHSQHFPDSRLLVVGIEDPMADPQGASSREVLTAKCQALGLADKVIFTGYRPDVADIMAALDVFVMPAWEEGFGLVFLEAMASGTPVIGWRSGGVIDIIEHRISGWLIEPKNHAQLVQALGEAAGSEDMRRLLAHGGKARVQQRFLPKICHKQLLEVFESLASPKA